MSIDPRPSSSVFRTFVGVVAGAAGVVAFLNYFLPDTAITLLARPLLQAVVLLTALGLLLTSARLVVRHLLRIRRSPASGALAVGFALALAAGLLPEGFEGGVGAWLYQWLLGPGLAAVFALLPVFLVFALWRHLRLGDAGLVLFALSLVLVLLAQTPWLATRVPALAAARHNLLVGLGAAVFRGLFIGLAVGLILAALSRLFPQRRREG
jgi:hypothetical protein